MSIQVVLILTAAIVIFAIVRALKSDTPIPWTVPPKWRPVLAIVLGQVGSAITSIAKARWPNVFAGVSYEEIFGIGATGSAFSALINGTLQTKEAIQEKTPVIVKSIPPKADLELQSPPVEVPKPPPLPPGTGTPLVFLLVAIGAVASLTPYALCSCSADKPIVKANPEAANCISNKGIRERECVLNARTEAEADTCIAQVRASTTCTDGGK